MITTTDIKNILYEDCSAFGMKICRNPLKEVLSKESIVIHTKRQKSERLWKKSFAEVNICVPDLGGVMNDIRLEECEHQAILLLNDVTGVHDGTRYRYDIESVGVEADTALKCHYVNVRILFEVLNTI